jgi:hypothetical protein
MKADDMCPGKTGQSVNVGHECWAAVWVAGGCKAANLPAYEAWHSSQNLEVLVADVVQWANLPDARHKEGCYGNSGAPVNEPAPPQPGTGLGSGVSMLGGLPPLGSGLGDRQSNGGLGSGGAPSAPGQVQGPAPPPEVVQKIQTALDSSAGLCSGVGRQATAVGESCWTKIWTHVGCLEASTPRYEEWHNAQSFEVLVADAAQWATLPSQKHKAACYGLSTTSSITEL